MTNKTFHICSQCFKEDKTVSVYWCESGDFYTLCDSCLKKSNPIAYKARQNASKHP